MSSTTGVIKGLWSVDRDAKRVAVVMLDALACGAILVMACHGVRSALGGSLQLRRMVLGVSIRHSPILPTDTARTVTPTVSDSTDNPAGTSLPSALSTNEGAGSATPRAKVLGGPSTAVNTNLEQISDWLTKIIVGVTLVESRKVLDCLSQVAQLMADSIGGAHLTSIAFAIPIYFSFPELLGSYLLTRLFLQRAFTNAANSA